MSTGNGPVPCARRKTIAGTDDGATYQVEDFDDDGRVVATRYGARDEPVLGQVWDAAGERSTLQPPAGHRYTVVRSARAGYVVGFAAEDGWGDPVGVVWDVRRGGADVRGSAAVRRVVRGSRCPRASTRSSRTRVRCTGAHTGTAASCPLRRTASEP
ncbi:hypothetical protein ACVDFE_14420 [Lentzea chajnantorensis]